MHYQLCRPKSWTDSSVWTRSKKSEPRTRTKNLDQGTYRKSQTNPTNKNEIQKYICNWFLDLLLFPMNFCCYFLSIQPNIYFPSFQQFWLVPSKLKTSLQQWNYKWLWMVLRTSTGLANSVTGIQTALTRLNEKPVNSASIIYKAYVSLYIIKSMLREI